MAVKNLAQSGLIFNERRRFYLRPQVTAELWPSVSPFLSDLMSRPAEPSKDPDFKLFEHRSGFVKQQFSINDATLTVNYDTYVPGDLATAAAIDGISGLGAAVDDSYAGLVVEVWDENIETFKGLSRIQSVSSGAVSFVSLGNPRHVANYHAALANNDVCIVVTNAFGEGTVAPEAFHDELEVVYNSAQILKVPVEITGTLYEAALRGYSNELARLRVEKMKEFKTQLNKMYLRGVRPHGIGSTDLSGLKTATDSFATHITDADGKTVRMSMGMIPAIYKYGSRTGAYKNIFDINGQTYGWRDFVKDTETLFQYVPGSGVKRAACGMGAISYWSILSGGEGFMKNSKWKVEISDFSRGSLGFNIRTLVTPHGLVELFWDPALSGPYHNTMMIYDPDHVSRVVYRNQSYRTNIKTDNDYDGIKDSFFADEGLRMNLIEAHSVWNIAY